jgi:hypothetical protein
MAAAVRWWPSISHIRCSSTYVCHDIFALLSSFCSLGRGQRGRSIC